MCPHFAFALVVISLLSSLSSSQADSLDTYLQSVARQYQVPGLAVCVIQRGKIVAQQVQGQSNLELKTPVSPQTVFQLASITKPFTALALTQFIEQGALDVNRPITSYLDSLPPRWNAITVSHLLTHTSGLFNYEEVTGFEQRIFLDRPHTQVIREVIQSLWTLPLRFIPGQQSEYCNTNYFVLGMLLEKLSGTSYADFLRRQVFQPLNMNSTRVDERSAVIAHRASGYVLINNQLVNADPISKDWLFGEGWLVSSVEDMAKWVIALLTNSTVSAQRRQLLWTAGRLNDGRAAEYGFGWKVFTEQGRRNVSHSGHNPGFSAFVRCDLDRQTAVVILANQEGLTTPQLNRVAGRILTFYP